MANDNPFRVLGLAPTDDLVQIRAAFRAEARRWHPDLNSDPEAPERFHRAEQAYQLLGDPTERRRAIASFDQDTSPVPQLLPVPSWEHVSDWILAHLARSPGFSLWPVRAVFAVAVVILVAMGDPFSASAILVVAFLPRVLSLVLLAVLVAGLLMAGLHPSALVVGGALALSLVFGELRHWRARRARPGPAGSS